MRRIFSIKPGMTLKGRQFRGLRGLAGKPLHPPLTDFPVAAYFLAMVFDVISFALHGRSDLTRDFFVAGTYVMVGGAVISGATAITGLWDWFSGTQRGTQARRTANWHMALMFTVTAIVIADIAYRLTVGDVGYATLPVVAASVAAGAIVSLGAAYGGTLVYDYGFNVEGGRDHPAWQQSETDVYPGGY